MQSPGDKQVWRLEDNQGRQAENCVEFLSPQQYSGAGLKPAPTATEITSGKLLYALSTTFCNGLIISALVLLTYSFLNAGNLCSSMNIAIWSLIL